MTEEKMQFDRVYTEGAGPRRSGRKALAEDIFTVIHEYEMNSGETVDEINLVSTNDGIVSVDVTLSSTYTKEGEPNGGQ